MHCQCCTKLSVLTVQCLTMPESVLSYILNSLRILKALSLLLPSLALMRSRMVLIILARRLLYMQAAGQEPCTVLSRNHLKG